jgi:excisionase family DNA binding protein
MAFEPCRACRVGLHPDCWGVSIGFQHCSCTLCRASAWLNPYEVSHYLSTKELMERLGVCRSTVYKLMRDWGLPFIKIGRLNRFPTERVVAWMEQRRGKGDA